MHEAGSASRCRGPGGAPNLALKLEASACKLLSSPPGTTVAARGRRLLGWRLTRGGRILSSERPPTAWFRSPDPNTATRTQPSRRSHTGRVHQARPVSHGAGQTSSATLHAGWRGSDRYSVDRSRPSKTAPKMSSPIADATMVVTTAPIKKRPRLLTRRDAERASRRGRVSTEPRYRRRFLRVHLRRTRGSRKSRTI